MVNLWFTEKDLRYRWSEVKDNFWDDFEILTKDVARQMLERGLQIERESMIGASHYERSSDRKDYRNGYYSRNVICKLGVLSKVLMPRSRYGVYQSEIIERYKRFGGNFDQYMLKLFSLGLATRRVESFFTDFFGEVGFSSQTVSNILKKVSYELDQYRHRQLSDDIKYLYLDGTYVTIRSAFKRKQVILFAIAEYLDGHREIVDFKVFSSEKGIYWQSFLDNLYRRGLTGRHLQLIVTDGASGLIEAVRTVYGHVPLQVCWIHRQRNMIGRLKHRHNRREICGDISAIFKADSHREAVKLLFEFQRKWQTKESQAVRLFLRDIDISLTFYSQPKEKWKQLASNNFIERQIREVKRRVKLIDSFRDEKSCERIIFTQVLLLNEKLELNQ